MNQCDVKVRKNVYLISSRRVLFLLLAAVAIATSVTPATAQTEASLLLNARNARVDTASFDWAAGVSALHVTSHWRLLGEYRRERIDDSVYDAVQAQAGLMLFGFETGAEYVDREDGDLYLLKMYAEKKFWQNRLGVGITQSWADRWFESGDTMLRLSLSVVDSLGPAELRVLGSYNRNIERQHLSFRLDAPISWGRLSIGPYANIQIVEKQVTLPDGSSSDDVKKSWEVQLKITYLIRPAS